MFGYIIINKGDLKFKEYDIYRGYYCGLCRTLKQKYGLKGQATLSYDMTFLALLLSALYEPEIKKGVTSCIAHPFEKHPTIITPYTEYAADMNVLLTYHKCLDDWKDEKKLGRKMTADMLSGAVKRITEEYPGKAETVETLLSEMAEEEKKGCKDADKMADMFGQILGEIFSYKEDEWSDELFTIGYKLGRFIYICDAYEDIEDDIKKKQYNPFTEYFWKDDFNEGVGKVLTKEISDCCKTFELLPIINDIDILRNILYSGVWSRYELVKNKRNKKEESNA